MSQGGLVHDLHLILVIMAIVEKKKVLATRRLLLWCWNTMEQILPIVIALTGQYSPNTAGVLMHLLNCYEDIGYENQLQNTTKLFEYCDKLIAVANKSFKKGVDRTLPYWSPCRTPFDQIHLLVEAIGHKASGYQTLEDFKTSEKLYHEAIDLGTASGYKDLCANIWHNLATLHEVQYVYLIFNVVCIYIYMYICMRACVCVCLFFAF